MKVSEVTISVRVSEVLNQVLEGAAGQNHCGVSTFVRRFLEQAFGLEQKLILPDGMEPLLPFNHPMSIAPRGRQRRRSA